MREFDEAYPTPAPGPSAGVFKACLLGGPKVDDFSIKPNRDTGRAVEL